MNFRAEFAKFTFVLYRVSEKDVAYIFRVEQRLLPASFWFLS
jgi:hypothetical protein